MMSLTRKLFDFFAAPDLVLPTSRRFRYTLYVAAILAQIPLAIVRKKASLNIASSMYWGSVGISTCLQIFTTTINPVLGGFSAITNCIASRFVVVGITGNAGCGKSTLVKYLQANNFHIINANTVTNELSQPGKAIHKAFVNAFGTRVLVDPTNPNSPLDKAKIRQLVIENRGMTERLNAIARRPLYFDIMRRVFILRILQWRENVAVEATRLYEDGYTLFCSPVMLIGCDTQIQAYRLNIRDGGQRTLDDVEKMNSTQWTYEMKRKVADFLLDNNGSVQAFLRSVRQQYFNVFMTPLISIEEYLNMDIKLS